MPMLMAETPELASSTPTRTRFTSQAASVEDRLKADTVGLVTLDDFRKRRAEALEAAQTDSTPASGATTPEAREPVSKPAFKKRKKGVKTGGGLSFGNDEHDAEVVDAATLATTRRGTSVEADSSAPATDSEGPSDSLSSQFKKKSLRPNFAVSLQPKAMTKSAMLKEAQLKDQLKREYTQMQEAVKATEFMVPFVFYDGKNLPGGTCRMKKGDHIWLFLERARKVGAEKADKSRKDWARISVDDLMFVRGDLIIPHHYDFYYFLVNKTVGCHGAIFTFSAEPTTATPQHLLPLSATSPSATPGPAAEVEHLQTAAQRKLQAATQSGPPDVELEGFSDDPSLTRVVDRRWYERNKHIYPASSWEEFDTARDYSSGSRKDKDGNVMFFSR